MPSLTQLAHEALIPIVKPGDIVIDATAGNGHDTCFLAELVGTTGRVLACDNQAAAIARTAQRVNEFHFTQVTLFHCGHEALRELVPSSDHGRVAAIMWNLGYLPGSDQAHVTQRDSTLQSFSEGLPLLKPGGRATILAYSGHAGGAAECAAVAQFMNGLPREAYRVEVIDGQPGRASSPQLFVVEKLPTDGNPSVDQAVG